MNGWKSITLSSKTLQYSAIFRLLGPVGSWVPCDWVLVRVVKDWVLLKVLLERVFYSIHFDWILLEVFSDGFFSRILSDRVLSRLFRDRVIFRVYNDRILRFVSNGVLSKDLSDRVVFKALIERVLSKDVSDRVVFKSWVLSSSLRSSVLFFWYVFLNNTCSKITTYFQFSKEYQQKCNFRVTIFWLGLPRNIFCVLYNVQRNYQSYQIEKVVRIESCFNKQLERIYINKKVKNVMFANFVRSANQHCRKYAKAQVLLDPYLLV